MARLAIDLAGLTLSNPVLSASGTFGHGIEMRQFVGAGALGAWVSKTVTRRPRPGNAMPRIAETEAGLLNSIGLENRGLEDYLARVLPEIAAAGAVVVTNVGGESIEDFGAIAAALDGEAAIHALEVNLSCPNVDGGRLPGRPPGPAPVLAWNQVTHTARRWRAGSSGSAPSPDRAIRNGAKVRPSGRRNTGSAA